jgi:CHAD domain-containing protein
MLNGKKQRKYLAKNGREWQDQLQVFGRDRKEEALHDLRVAVKKIKAFTRLSEACSGKAAVKDFRLLKKMFRQAGAVRDLGNLLGELDHFRSVPGEFKRQKRQLKEAETTVFIDHIGQYCKKGKKAGRRLLHDVHTIRSACIRNWYAEQLVDIGVLLTASGNRLHKARKRIKEILYVLKVLPAALAEELALDTKYLDDVQDAIGKWHDAVIVVTSWAGKDRDSSQEMVRECRDREAVVRRLGDEFYLRAHVR